MSLIICASAMMVTVALFTLASDVRALTRAIQERKP